MILDFFLEDSDVDFQGQLEESNQNKASSGNNMVSDIFQDMEKALSTSLVAKVGGVFKFKIDGEFLI